MNESVLNELMKGKGGWNQLNDVYYHLSTKCDGEVIEVFCSVDSALMAHVCSECGEIRDEN